MGLKAIVKESDLNEIKSLSTEHQKEVLNFVSYLKAKEELDATKDILNDSDFIQSIMKGDEDFKKGCFKKWSEVKENV